MATQLGNVKRECRHISRADLGIYQRGVCVCGGGGQPLMHGGPGNVFTILEMVYSGALRGESMLKWMICKPPWTIVSSY